MPRFSHVHDPNVNKFRGKAYIDANCLLFPRVIGLKGRFGLEVFETPLAVGNDIRRVDPSTDKIAAPVSPSPKKGGKDESVGGSNLYKTLGTRIGIEMVLEKQLLNRKKLTPVEKTVRHHVPKRAIPSHMMFEKRSRKAESDYTFQIQDIVKKLVLEYQGVLQKIIAQSGDISSNGMFSRVDGGNSDSILNLLPLPFVPAESLQEEQQRKKNFMFHLNKSGAYFFFKEQLKSAVVEVVREV